MINKIFKKYYLHIYQKKVLLRTLIKLKHGTKDEN